MEENFWQQVNFPQRLMRTIRMGTTIFPFAVPIPSETSIARKRKHKSRPISALCVLPDTNSRENSAVSLAQRRRRTTGVAIRRSDSNQFLQTVWRYKPEDNLVPSIGGVHTPLGTRAIFTEFRDTESGILLRKKKKMERNAEQQNVLYKEKENEMKRERCLVRSQQVPRSCSPRCFKMVSILFEWMNIVESSANKKRDKQKPSTFLISYYNVAETRRFAGRTRLVFHFQRQCPHQKRSNRAAKTPSQTCAENASSHWNVPPKLSAIYTEENHL
ncbi:hypothetical protein OUZ56_015998 [Daphnia magna]|uniref:Uncharacterized protein n=1 Tax=Daphnia magna TaxID=35525 RepID=A0ABR0APD0_9CRUS|nr:hypothetical protein OUZ56_015998 [Daphnia magna]